MGRRYLWWRKRICLAPFGSSHFAYVSSTFTHFSIRRHVNGRQQTCHQRSDRRRCQAFWVVCVGRPKLKWKKSKHTHAGRHTNLVVWTKARKSLARRRDRMNGTIIMAVAAVELWCNDFSFFSLCAKAERAPLCDFYHVSHCQHTVRRHKELHQPITQYVCLHPADDFH